MKILFFLFPLLIFVTPMAFAETTNVGTIYWKQEIVTSNSFVDIYVHDDDMNKKEYPNFADSFLITVWSDTSTEGLEIRVLETGVYSGIFKGSVYIADSGETAKNRLVSNPGDVLYAKYVDSTVPDGDSLDIISAAMVKIPGEDMDEFLNKIDPSLRSIKNTETKIPTWVKSNAGWWADGTISESDFLMGIEYMVTDGILVVPPTTVSQEQSDSVPTWVKSNAGWWADGTISDSDFINGIQYLVESSLISITEPPQPVVELSSKSKNMADPALDELESKLEECSKITTSYKRIDCEKPIKKAMTLHSYKTQAEKFDVGPITYYWFGVGSAGNEFEITATGQPILSIRMLAENTSSEVVGLNCTSPAICSYDVWDGTKSFKYSGMDFTSGQIVLNPNDAREFNILFGPNIGYGGTEFEYDSSKNYYFRINENFGSTSVLLNLE